jgi:hypothetical protein
MKIKIVLSFAELSNIKTSPKCVQRLSRCLLCREAEMDMLGEHINALHKEVERQRLV